MGVWMWLRLRKSRANGCVLCLFFSVSLVEIFTMLKKIWCEIVIQMIRYNVRLVYKSGHSEPLPQLDIIIIIITVADNRITHIKRASIHSSALLSWACHISFWPFMTQISNYFAALLRIFYTPKDWYFTFNASILPAFFTIATHFEIAYNSIQIANQWIFFLLPIRNNVTVGTP